MGLLTCMTRGNKVVADVSVEGHHALRMCVFIVLPSPLLLIGRDRRSRVAEANPFVPGKH